MSHRIFVQRVKLMVKLHIKNKSLINTSNIRKFSSSSIYKIKVTNQLKSQDEKKEMEKCEASKLESCIPDPCSVDPECEQPRVVIIGAGIAGLSAAQRLNQCGISNTVILEALSRPGGRIHTCWMAEKPVELGALWIEGSCIKNPVFNLACQEGLLKPPLHKLNPSRGIYFNSSGKVLPSSLVYEAYKKFRIVKQQAQSLFGMTRKIQGSLMNFMNYKLKNDLKLESQQVLSIIYSLMNDIRCKWGQDLSKMSAEQFGSFTEIPGEKTYLPLGFNGILAPLIRDINISMIKYNKPVKCITWGPSRAPRAIVKCQDGENIAADYVIITVSLGVLKSQVNNFFCPKLPLAKLNAIKKLGFGHINRLYFEYDKPFWVRSEGFLKPVWSEEELSNRSEWVKSIGMIEEVPGCPNALMCDIGGLEALCIESLPENKIVHEITKLIRRFTGDPTLPFPKTMLRSMWSSDPYFEGATSYMGLESKTAHQTILGNPVPMPGQSTAPILLFAGEATTPGHYGTVHGARLSGIREAERILDLTRSLGGPPKCEEPQTKYDRD